LPWGGSWNDYHFYNRVHFSHPAYAVPSCAGAQPSTFSVGYAYGWVWNAVYYQKLISEQYGYDVNGNPVCNAYDTTITVLPPGALTVRIYRSSTGWWNIDAWTGQWTRVNTFSTPWNVAAEIEAGQELWSRNGTLGNIRLPVNFVHKAQIAGTNQSFEPWHDYALNTSLSGISNSPTFLAGPLQLMDLMGNDYTSMASHAND
jgi:hypothetical protein